MARSDIQWCTHTWNPVIGCTKVPVDGSVQKGGCFNCYAEVMHKRNLANPLQKDYTDPFNVVKMLPGRLNDPAKFPDDSTVFLCSQGDLFHEDVSFEFINKVFASMYRNNQHTYKILTKRPERVIEYERYRMSHTWELKPTSKLVWRQHIQLGTSVGSQLAIDRVIHLVQTAAKVKFLSCEPLLGPLDLTYYLDGIDQVIVGGEAIQGRKHKRLRPMKEEWARDIRDQCLDSGTPFFFKQMGNQRDPETGKMLSKKVTGELLDGVEWKQDVELEVLE